MECEQKKPESLSDALIIIVFTIDKLFVIWVFAIEYRRWNESPFGPPTGGPKMCLGNA